MGLAPDHAVVLDCEFLTSGGAPQRFWCGPGDPDPTVVQIGAVRLGLTPPYPVLEGLDLLIRATDRAGAAVRPDPVFQTLTGITPDHIAARGIDLAQALAVFTEFCGTATIWSWGKDELNLMAISTYVAGIAPPLPAGRFGNACRLLVRAGVPETQVHSLRSHSLCAYFDLPPPAGAAHDALHDARSLATVLALLLTTRRIFAADFAAPPLDLG